MILPVTIIGAGPAGLTAARTLTAAGVADILVLERESEAGGLPRNCGHIGWGVLDFHRCWRGPTYARHLTTAAAGAEIRTGHSVTAMLPGGVLQVSTPDGLQTLQSRAVLIAAGIREKPRSARLISGTRPFGVLSTGAFQDLVYRRGLRPFQAPVIIGTELVAFSALLTARHAGIRPIAMIEAADRITARRPGDLVASHILRVPVHTRTRLVRIEGEDRVTGIVVERDGQLHAIDCDGVVLTGDFVPETGVIRTSHLDIDRHTGGPSIDTTWRCSDPAYFAAGNVLRPVEHSGAAAQEGALAAAAIVHALRSDTAPGSTLPIRTGKGLRYVYPQRLAPGDGPIHLFARASAACKGMLTVSADGQTILRRAVHALPERRLTLTLPAAARLHPRAFDVDLA